MDKEALAEDLLTAFGSINKKDFFDKAKFNFKGENLMLAILMQAGGKATPGEIMRYADFTAARLTAIAKKLESKGFVKRIQNLQDKRSTIIEMTYEGVVHFKIIQKEIIGNVLNLIEHLGENDAEEFLRLIKRLAEVTAKI